MQEAVFNNEEFNCRIAGLKPLLDEYFRKFNVHGFIKDDPVSIPHIFTRKEDIEIAGFLTAILAWGNRKSIINNATKLVGLMDNAPFEFVTGFEDADLKPFLKFVHRTFNGEDCLYFLYSLKNIYINHGGLEALFTTRSKDDTLKEKIIYFRNVFFELSHLKRTEKHVADPARNSAAKRINMFLRWMVRRDNKGVDFGLWENVQPFELLCPLDVHSGRVARRLGLLSRKQDDWKAVMELTNNLKLLDPNDPVKYDFALFGIGVFEKH